MLPIAQDRPGMSEDHHAYELVLVARGGKVF